MALLEADVDLERREATSWRRVKERALGEKVEDPGP